MCAVPETWPTLFYETMMNRAWAMAAGRRWGTKPWSVTVVQGGGGGVHETRLQSAETSLITRHLRSCASSRPSATGSVHGHPPVRV